jgi:alkylresorcinol/alkylpyrone synthase
MEKVHRNVQVEGRHLALPIENYFNLKGFGASNSAWIQVALQLGEKVLCDLLEQAGLDPSEVGQLAFTTVTGIAVPSIDARLMNRIPFSPHLKRLPLFGLGCLGGAAGIARTADYLEGHPQEAAMLLSVELCSLTIQREDLTVANMISSGLFGDGAAGVLMVGEEHPLARPGQTQVVASRSVFFPNTEYIMGWDVVDTGFKIVLSSDVAEVAEIHLRPALDAFLEDFGLSIPDIAYWMSHPGGPKVIEGIEAGLGLPSGALDLSRESLAKVGNISSSSVLMILQETLARRHPEPGEYGLLLAMGPAFCAELVLLRW